MRWRTAPISNYIRAHYNRSKQIDPPFFQELLRSAKEKELNYKTNLFARMVSPLDRLFGGIGERVEKTRRTYTSWFTEEDFNDLPGLGGPAAPGRGAGPALQIHLRQPERGHAAVAGGRPG